MRLVVVEFRVELRQRRLARKLSQAKLAEEIKFAESYVTRIESGARPVTISFARACDRVLEAGGVLLDLAKQEVALRGQVCPYRGLQPFESGDSTLFFGRERVVAELLSRLAEQVIEDDGPLMLVGASGAGKSSLLRAGVVPQLRLGALPGVQPQRWAVEVFTPGEHPLRALTDALGAEPVDFMAQAEGEMTAGHWSPRVLVVDQFEEVFTLCRDAAERSGFVASLCELCRAHAGGKAALVVVSVRADFYGRCLEFTELVPALRRQLPLGPMSEQELRSAIVEPARACRLKLDDGLVELILRDAAAREGAGDGGAVGVLPLLSHALLATWQMRQEGQQLTVSAYLRSGGLRGAVATTAERVYQQLEESEKDVARRLLLRLVAVHSHDAPPARRRVPLAQLEWAHQVVEVFAQARLVTVTQDTVEIAHEALLTAWPTLAGMIAADREGVRRRQRLDADAEEWRQSPLPELLYRGTRLAVTLEWARSCPDLSIAEQAFLDAAVYARDREIEEAERRRRAETEARIERERAEDRHRADQAELARVEAERAAAEARAQRVRSEEQTARARQQARYRRRQVRTLAAASLALALLGVLVIMLWRSSVEQGATALAGQYGDRSLARPDQPDLAMMLAVRARRTGTNPAAVNAVLSAQAQDFAGQFLVDPIGRAGEATAVATAGDLVAAIGDQPRVHVWNRVTRREVDSFQVERTVASGSTRGVFGGLAFGPDGLTLAASDGRAVVLRQVAAHRSITLPAGQTVLAKPALHGVSFSRSGRLVAGSTGVWDVPSGRLLRPGFPGGEVNTVAFTSDEQHVLTVSDDGHLRLCPITSGPPERDKDLGHGHLRSVAVSPDGSLAAVAGWDGVVTLLHLPDLQPAGELRGHKDTVLAVVFSPDGKLLATGAEDRTARIWDTATRRLLTTENGHTGDVDSVAFTTDGQTLATGGGDGLVKLWRLESTRHTVAGGGLSGVSVSPDQRSAATVGGDGVVRLWNTATHQQTGALPTKGQPLHAVAFSPDRVHLAAVGDARVWVWDLRTGRLAWPPYTAPDWTAPGWLTSLSYDSTGRRLAVAGGRSLLPGSRIDYTVTVLDTATGRLAAPPLAGGHYDQIRSVVFQPGADRLASAGLDQAIDLWNVRSGALEHRIPGFASAVSALAFTRDGRMLVNTSHDQRITVWNPVTRKAIGTAMTGHTKPIEALALSPDQELLATSARDGTTWVWNLRRRTPLATLTDPVPDQDVNGVAFIDEQHLVTVTSKGVLRFWDLNPDRAEARICRAVTGIPADYWRTLISDPPDQGPCPPLRAPARGP
ncbi:helix-turn-helix domain-containing protein [Actinomadura logoneensis]|uniref:Helix-turn-helix domain-containing protein n=1 Tax=Actinomadura logoneensis TaxID=2293572 RepID=A0A372J970_9ACTN|nr:helix-turn-helix domain-containing protein [Actinomadura logoneensis]RFU36354.1 helix-turn-helix domain-containing protein [Actinomadura logoneensis]